MVGQDNGLVYDVQVSVFSKQTGQPSTKGLTLEGLTFEAPPVNGDEIYISYKINQNSNPCVFYVGKVETVKHVTRIGDDKTRPVIRTRLHSDELSEYDFNFLSRIYRKVS